MSKIIRLSLLACLAICLFTLLELPVLALEPNEQIIVADAGNDRFNKVGTEIVFDASSSNIPEGVEPVYRWDMGDGTIRFGMRNIYSYATVGVYKVKLVVEGKNTELISTDESIIHVFDEQLVIVSTEKSVSPSSLAKIEKVAVSNNIAFHNIRLDQKYASSLLLKEALIDRIISNNALIDDSNYLALVGDASLEAFISYKNRSDINLSNKRILYILQDSKWKSMRKNLAVIANNIYDSNHMKLVDLKEISATLFDFSANNNIEFDVISTPERPVFQYMDFLYKFNIHLIEGGFSLDIIYFLYIMLLISIFSLILRKLLGLAVVSVHILGLTIFAFIILGVLPSLIMLTGFFVISYIVQRIYETDRDTLFSGNFIDMIMFIFFIVLGYSIVQSFFPIDSFEVSVFLSIILIGISARRLARYTVGMGVVNTFIYFIQDVVFLIINYFLLTSYAVRLHILSYPEIFVVLIFLTAILLERYRGLRFTELIRFRQLLQSRPYMTDGNE